MQIDFAHQTRTYLGLYELELNSHLRRILKPGVKSFDVGAQHGYDSLVIAKYTNAQVVSFECELDCVRRMSTSFALNPSLARFVIPVEAMVGDGSGQLGLDKYAYGENGFVPDFIKIDIEGGEVSALKSAAKILRERRPALVIEVHSAQLERGCIELLVEHGYQPNIINQRRFFPDRRPTDEVNRWLVAS